MHEILYKNEIMIFLIVKIWVGSLVSYGPSLFMNSLCERCSLMTAIVMLVRVDDRYSLLLNIYIYIYIQYSEK